jgi:hypothetical protein
LKGIEPGTALRRHNQFTSTIVRNYSQKNPTVSFFPIVPINKYGKYLGGRPSSKKGDISLIIQAMYGTGTGINK